MTETQKLIATEIVKQKSRIFNLSKQREGFSGQHLPFLSREIEGEMETAREIEEVLSRLLANVCYAKTLGAV